MHALFDTGLHPVVVARSLSAAAILSVPELAALLRTALVTRCVAVAEWNGAIEGVPSPAHAVAEPVHEADGALSGVLLSFESVPMLGFAELAEAIRTAARAAGGRYARLVAEDHGAAPPVPELPPLGPLRLPRA